jgi:prepilin-type N-terminal cleavage/methylation domain-containing protein
MRREKGFTLIELLVVIAIIGILAAIAIPQFAEYRQRGFDSRAKSDLRNVATAEEAYFADTEAYLACSLANGTGNCNALPGVEVMSQGTNLAMVVVGTNASFTGTATNSRGTGVTYNWNSANGGLQ